MGVRCVCCVCGVACVEGCVPGQLRSWRAQHRALTAPHASRFHTHTPAPSSCRPLTRTHAHAHTHAQLLYRDWLKLPPSLMTVKESVLLIQRLAYVQER
jgi:hypothetical protein